VPAPRSLTSSVFTNSAPCPILYKEKRGQIICKNDFYCHEIGNLLFGGGAAMSQIKNRYSVGEVAKLSNVTPKTLRYYDEIELVIPNIDERNNYRSYTREQIQDIITIKKLKGSGLRLKEIRDYLRFDSRQKKAGLLTAKIEECSKEIERLKSDMDQLLDFKNRLSDSFYDNLSQGDKIVAREKYAPGTVAFFEYNSSAYVSNLFLEYEIELENFIEENDLVPTGKLTAFFCQHFSHQFFDIPTRFQIFIPIEKSPVASRHIRNMEERDCLTTMHFGSYAQIMEAYHRILAYGKANKIALCGQAFESYLIGPNLIKNESEFITKIYMPINAKN
jgi:DNA-binding transcriptional MerR regulator